MIHFKVVNLLLTSFLSIGFAFSQPPNDGCGNAISLCPNNQQAGSNYAATSTVCPACDDDFSFCFSGTNSVWYRFTTNSNGGNASVNISNIVFNSSVTRGTQLQGLVVHALSPCDASTFTAVSNCEAGSASNFVLTATGLLPNTDYYIVLNGAKNGGATLPAEATFDIQVGGTGVDRLPLGISINGPSGIICPDQPVAFTTYLGNCTDTSLFHWSVNGLPAATTTESFWITSAITDGAIISVTCSCFDVCIDTLQSTFGPISVDQLFVDAGTDISIFSGDVVQLIGNSNGTNFSWAPIYQVVSPNNLTTLVTPTTTTTYFLSASDNTCTVVDEVTVFVKDALIIPGSFSPNGDGINDVWIIDGISFYPDAHVLIYDRWGQVTADITAYSFQKAWDGTKAGKAVTDGVYFYELNLNDATHKEVMKGSLSVIR
jgi:gliding motility-associated-like protein